MRNGTLHVETWSVVEVLQLVQPVLLQVMGSGAVQARIESEIL